MSGSTNYRYFGTAIITGQAEGKLLEYSIAWLIKFENESPILLVNAYNDQSFVFSLEYRDSIGRVVELRQDRQLFWNHKIEKTKKNEKH